MTCASSFASFPRAFAFPYAGSEFKYDSISHANAIESFVATGTVKWNHSTDTPWPGKTKVYNDFITDYTN